MKKNKPYIENIIFESTQACNLSCAFCYNIWKNEKANADKFSSPYKQSVKTLKRLIRSGNIQSITFTGGEPFLADRLDELILLCRLKNIFVSVISNGTSGTYETYRQLHKMGVNLIQFTLLSHLAGVHDDITGKKGAWLRVSESIRQTLKIGYEVVGVCVISKANYNHIPETLQYYLDLGVKTVMLNRFNIGGQGIKEIERLQLTKKELQFAFSSANEFAQHNIIELSSNVCTPWCILYPKDYPNIGFLECAVADTQKPYTIDSKGNFRICNHSPRVIGNIHTHTLTELTQNEYVASWGKIKPEFCIDCNLFDTCQGGCRGASEQMGLGLEHADPILFQK